MPIVQRQMSLENIMKEKRFKIQFHFIDFYNISFGINICLSEPNIELHLPFSFIRIGLHLSDNKRIFEISSKKGIQRENLKIIEELNKNNGEKLS